MDQTFDAVEHGGHSERVLGVVTMTADGTLSVVTATPGSETLQTIVDELNQETQLHGRAVPPPGARRFEVFTQPVQRGSEGFVPAMMEFLRKYHDIELRSR